MLEYAGNRIKCKQIVINEKINNYIEMAYSLVTLIPYLLS